MTAVLQFEVERGRLEDFPRLNAESAMNRVRFLARMSLADTFDNGGTFVVVVSAEKITIVQRVEAEDFDDKALEKKP